MYLACVSPWEWLTGRRWATVRPRHRACAQQPCGEAGDRRPDPFVAPGVHQDPCLRQVRVCSGHGGTLQEHVSMLPPVLWAAHNESCLPGGCCGMMCAHLSGYGFLGPPLQRGLDDDPCWQAPVHGAAPAWLHRPRANAASPLRRDLRLGDGRAGDSADHGQSRPQAAEQGLSARWLSHACFRPGSRCFPSHDCHQMYAHICDPDVCVCCRSTWTGFRSRPRLNVRS
jgi:hypothetical protein